RPARRPRVRRQARYGGRPRRAGGRERGLRGARGRDRRATRVQPARGRAGAARPAALRARGEAREPGLHRAGAERGGRPGARGEGGGGAGGGGGGGGAGGGGGGGGGGASAVTGLARQVVLSPAAGEVKVSWHRSAIHVKPAEGWKRNRVYHLELLPGITDLRRNVMKKGATVVFATGPAPPQAS